MAMVFGLPIYFLDNENRGTKLVEVEANLSAGWTKAGGQGKQET